MTLRASRSGTDGQQLSRVNNADYLLLLNNPQTGILVRVLIVW